jgi:sodium-dependent phosphate cotransporter
MATVASDRIVVLADERSAVEQSKKTAAVLLSSRGASNVIGSKSDSSVSAFREQPKNEESSSSGDKCQVVASVETTTAVQDKPLSIAATIFYGLGALIALYVFLVGLDLMGSSFKVLGGRGAGSMYHAVENPIGGLMTGILSTVLVQSSSTSTSIVVAMVGAGQINVRHGIPIIMGANIGTSVTNTIVSMGQMGNRIDLERSFAGATVHDMFNMLTVATLLPIESIAAAVQGEGGPLYWITYWVTEGLMGHEKGEDLFTSPIKAITNPVKSLVLQENKYVIYGLTLGRPTSKIPEHVNSTACKDEESRRLLSRRLHQESPTSAMATCTEFFCVGKRLDQDLEKISKSGYKKLTHCDGFILDAGGNPCAVGEACFLDAGAYYDERVQHGELIKGGFLESFGDAVGGAIGLAISLLLLTSGLVGLCKLLQKVFMGKAKSIIRYSTKLNDYVAILVGVGITIVVQSSSVVTSALTPLCGLGVLPLAKMLPLTVGANVGTTCTALLASLVNLSFDAVQIALCHLGFNIIGILIWFPIPSMRNVPLEAARLLGLYASYYRFVPLLYILITFVAVPAVGLGISSLFDVSIVASVVLLFFVVLAILVFVFLWVHGYPFGGENALCYRVLYKAERLQGERDLAAANAAIMGYCDASNEEAAKESNATDTQSGNEKQQEIVVV